MPWLGPSDSLPLLATHPGTPGLVAKLAQAQKKKKKNLKSFSGASNFPKFSPETDARKRPLLLFSPNQQSTYICYLLMHLTLLTLLSVKINVVKVKEIHRMTGKVQKIFTFKWTSSIFWQLNPEKIGWYKPIAKRVWETINFQILWSHIDKTYT